MSEQHSVLIAAFGGIFVYLLVGAAFAGFAKRVTGGHYIFPPNLIFWPIMMMGGTVLLVYALASGQRIKDLV